LAFSLAPKEVDVNNQMTQLICDNINNYKQIISNDSMCLLIWDIYVPTTAHIIVF